MNRCERKKEVGSQLDSDMAGQKRIAYVWSVLLAIGNVIFKIFPYFIIADVVKLFLSGEKEFEPYLVKEVLIVLSFIIAELFHSLSTALSHKATFTVLANIRKSCCDKLARVPLGYVKDTPSGTFKNIMVERIDSIETTLAHIVPEFTLGIVGPLITVGSYTDDLGKIGVIIDEVAGILEQPKLERSEKSERVPKDNSVTLENVRFSYHDKEILHGIHMELKL